MAMNERFLKACRREPVDATPVWLMRQAGRYMPAYRALREKYTILEMIKSPDLAAEVTFQPLRAFDLDVGIIFADILTLPEAMGLHLEFVQGEGPVFHNPIRHTDDIECLQTIDPNEALSFTMDAIRLVHCDLDGRLPLIGFSGAPFTLACYMIEGGGSKNFIQAKSFMLNQPKAWVTLLNRLADAVADYLVAQAEAGAAALQLFDSWVGILSPDDYAHYAWPYTRRVIQRVREKQTVPLIHFGTDTATLLPWIKQLGVDVIGVDWRVDLQQAWSILGEEHAIQGNLDPVTLFADQEPLRKVIETVCDAAGGRPGDRKSVV